MRRSLAVLLLASAVGVSEAEVLVVRSFDNNGMMTLAGLAANTTATIQWASSLTQSEQTGTS
jgi:hypothetical protein